MPGSPGPLARHRQDDRKGGLSLRGVAFMTVLAVLTLLVVLVNPLPSFCLSYKIQYQEATVAVLTVLAVSAVMAVPVMTATPLKRRRTNVQQLTRNIDLPCSFYYLFFSFVLIELKPFVLKGKVLGENFPKKCEKF